MFQRFLGALVAASLVASAGAQVYFDRGHTILIPGSSLIKRGRLHTNLLNPAHHAPRSQRVRR